MIQKFLVKLLLSPVALLYAIGISLHSMLYRIGLLKQVTFSFPIISVGNLSMGGTGKTPHVEYLVRELLPFLPVGVLSRGYGRKSKGYKIIDPRMNAEIAGDEPLQMKRKFPSSIVAVSENRALGIPQMLKNFPQLKVILMDDGFQHKPVNPALHILLTDYSYPFTQDHLLPVGRLREWRSGYKRADIIIVSKCPTDLSEEQSAAIRSQIQPLPHQKLYFSYFTYLHPYFLWNPGHGIVLQDKLDVLLISAIANTEYIKSYLEQKVNSVRSFEFEDHHYFTKYEVGQLKQQFENIPGKNKIIVTTEKDATRLALHRNYLISEKLPIFVLPVSVEFHPTSSTAFIDEIKSFLLDFKI